MMTTGTNVNAACECFVHLVCLYQLLWMAMDVCVCVSMCALCVHAPTGKTCSISLLMGLEHGPASVSPHSAYTCLTLYFPLAGTSLENT